MPYESGIQTETHLLQKRFPLRHYLVGLLFLVFDVEVMKGLKLLTIRHYNKEIVEKLTEGKTILLRQQTPETIQVLLS